MNLGTYASLRMTLSLPLLVDSLLTLALSTFHLLEVVDLGSPYNLLGPYRDELFSLPNLRKLRGASLIIDAVLYESLCFQHVHHFSL